MHRVELDGELLDLTPKEFDLLAFLAASPDQVYSREELLEHVWGSTQDWQDPATVTEHVRRLRLKLEADPASPRWLQTVRGVGYRLSHDDGGSDGRENRVHAGAEASIRSGPLADDREIESPSVVRVMGDGPSQSVG
jgi:DNA-binding winged helix-turn-helix (wHTH) protein